MNTTKNYTMRLRLNRDIGFTEDFRKRFMTKDYGNYDKYDKNRVIEEVDRGENDTGIDNFSKNSLEMIKRLDIEEAEEQKELDDDQFEDLLINDS
jgi:hypothetical protein